MALKVNEPLGKVDSLDLAEYVLFKGGKMSNLKLQKLLFYIQAYHLAYFEEPVIDDEFEAWVHGPVSRKVFAALKNSARLYDVLSYSHKEGEDTPDKVLDDHLTDEQIEAIDDVIEEFGTLSGLQLEKLTHSEDPWINARRGYAPADPCDKIIPKDEILNYYRNQLYTNS